jgi:phosphate transport system protein
VIARDQLINGLQVKADEDCVSLIALRQPLGSDLRMIMSLSNTVTDLERIGDGAKKIARMTVQIYDGVSSPPSAKLLRDVTPMAELAGDMLHDCLDASARLDVEKALTIIHDDDELDQEFQSALRRLITYMMEDSRTIGHAINVLFIIKALERIGDHCKNIAEHIVYLVEGKNIQQRRNIDVNTSPPRRECGRAGPLFDAAIFRAPLSATLTPVTVLASVAATLRLSQSACFRRMSASTSRSIRSSLADALVVILPAHEIAQRLEQWSSSQIPVAAPL